MARVIWNRVEGRTPVRRHEPATWPEKMPPGLSFKALQDRPVFGPLVESPLLHAALDDIVGVGRWIRPRRRATVLLSFPGPGPWVMPTGWHIDGNFSGATWPVPLVRMFSFFGPVEPEGGGTLLLEGSHHLVDRYLSSIDAPVGGNGSTWGRFLRQHPWLDQLRRGGSEDDPRREMLGTDVDVDGVAVRAVELVGDPGDLVLAHLHVFHCGSPNVSGRPRQMLSASARCLTDPDSRG